ncbi:aryl hydrocarbon receptor nuclear translocator-like protein 2 [Teleopsis dalmanni]|uniref:aryl hydrocarbon receptor nuclear translocator-like protein 2 n=1 Tax=Teleopsis dalmanni TaxID=139649 RepID=UPI0018CE7AEB|nr:aryl hydrocarbon receptor nuclear translocator-like protein 2 [Teleopsis dalmanni]
MEPSNGQIDPATTLNSSETHTEKYTSDVEEDYKTNIPYYAEDNNANSTQAINNYNTIIGKTEKVDRSPNTYNYQNWEKEEKFVDENHSRIDSDYSSYETSDTASFYSPTNNSATTPIQEMKYTPSDILFPPPPAQMRYHYNYSPQQNHPQQPHSYTSPPQYPRHMHPSFQAAYAAQQPAPVQSIPYGSYPQHPPNFPNMWHPNAPYGTGGGYGATYASHRVAQYNNSGYAHDHMMDMLQLSNSGREARNRAEKNRRDKLNGSIQELSTMVPHVAESPRRVDKTAVLRFAAHGLRLQYVFGNTLHHPRPQLTDTLMKLLDSFFLTLTCHGQIVLVSSSIEQHLGHCQADLYGQNILHITHPEDHAMLKQHLIPNNLDTLFDVQTENGSEPQPRTQAEEEYIDTKLREDKRNFTVRFARAGPRSEPTTYELIRIDGSFRRSDCAPRGVKANTFPSTLQLIRRTRGRDDSIPLHTISGNDIVLVAVARIIREPKIINRVADVSVLEYKTRHLIDGRIIDCDQRIGLVAGYMTDEVRNLSPFTFIHQDDVRWVIVALRQMYDCNSSYGESTYRLLTRNGHFIYLQSKGYLEIDKETNEVHSFICVNTLLDESEGKRRVQDMKIKYAVIVNKQIPQCSLIDVPASENPLQLERAVLCLIQNLQRSSSDDEEHNASSPGSYSSQRKRSLTNASSPYSTSASIRTTKTPPLSLVPPEASSVKVSISKSIRVISNTAAKFLRENQRIRSPSTSESNPEDVNNKNDGNEKNGRSDNNDSLCGTKRSISMSLSCAESDDDVQMAKRRLNSSSTA